MSEPTSKSGEPDQFAYCERAIKHANIDGEDYQGALEELTKARDRERVYRELAQNILIWFTTNDGTITRDALVAQARAALGEVAKMPIVEHIEALSAAEARYSEHISYCGVCHPGLCPRAEKLKATLDTLKAGK